MAALSRLTNRSRGEQRRQELPPSTQSSRKLRLLLERALSGFPQRVGRRVLFQVGLP
jgi:hypothetical protein